MSDYRAGRSLALFDAGHEYQKPFRRADDQQRQQLYEDLRAHCAHDSMATVKRR